jgi:hypothetical protein
MAGITNYPTALDSDSSLLDVTDGVSTLLDEHHNNTKEAVKAIETKLGIYATDIATTIDARLGHPTHGHVHDGASGQGVNINPTNIKVPSGGNPSGGSLHDFFMSATAVGNRYYIVKMDMNGSAIATINYGKPISIPRNLILESVRANLRIAPSGATTAFDVNIGPTSIYAASQGLRPIFPAGATSYGNASPNMVSYPSGTVMTLDVDAVGSNHPGSELTVTFVFRD